MLGTTLVASVLLLVAYSAAGPLHASCRVQWEWTVACPTVLQAILQQVATWNGAGGCSNGGEKCLYALVSQSDSELHATHETPVKHYVDDLTFTFRQVQSSCIVQGYSTSETWYAILDSGTNYCNLHNLITGAGLDKQPGYAETTSDNVCTQFSSANCTVY